jgi:hypothetical protein
VSHVGIQHRFGIWVIDGQRPVECLEDFEPPVVSLRERLDVGCDFVGDR